MQDQQHPYTANDYLLLGLYGDWLNRQSHARRRALLMAVGWLHPTWDDVRFRPLGRARSPYSRGLYVAQAP